VESWVSVLEHHCSSIRGITDQVRLENEARVAINGPEVVHSESVIREALRVGGHTHFIRHSENVKDWIVSKAVDSLTTNGPG
jgi:hypothetical protein